MVYRTVCDWIIDPIALFFFRIFLRQPPVNFKELTRKEAIDIWYGLGPLLAYHKLWLYGTPEYKTRPPPPDKAPVDPFHPKDDEDLVQLSPGFKPERLPFYPGYANTHIVACDKSNRTVHIRAVRSTSVYLQALRRLSVLDPRNHTVPILSLIPLKDWVLVVQPLWGDFWYNRPDISRSQRWRIALDLLEGLVFMHERGVAHGDIHMRNILDSRVDVVIDKDTPPLPNLSRIGYIDFDSSFIFPLDARDHTVTCDMAQTIPPPSSRAPEQSLDTGAWDAFAADVYNLGKVLAEYVAHEDIKPLDDIIEKMTVEAPAGRITAQQALDLLETYASDLFAGLAKLPPIT